MQLEILLYPHPALTTPTEPIIFPLSDEFKQTVLAVVELMWAQRACGLGANQLGLKERFFVLDPEACGMPSRIPLVFINPTLLSHSTETEKGNEGCMSFPGMFHTISRYSHVEVDAFDMDGNKFQVKGEGLTGRCLQHELDHLDGTLLVDHLGKTGKALALKQFRKRSVSQKRAVLQRSE